MPTGHERLYGIRTSSFKNLPQPPLESNIINALQNGGLSEQEIEYLTKALAKNKRAFAQFKFNLKRYRQKQQGNS